MKRLARLAVEPHYVRDYRRLVGTLKREAPSEREALERAVGGEFARQGALQAALVLETAPAGAFRIIDVGCGAGRATKALSGESRVSYLGVDVVPELLAHARDAAGRSDWRFELVSSLKIPCEDRSADIVMFMSVFTHLKPQEVQAYIAEAARVLKPGGTILASYLDRNAPAHVYGFRPGWRQMISRLLGRDVMVSRTTRAEISDWMERAGLGVERVLTEESFGQHVIIGRNSHNVSQVAAAGTTP